jgi:Replication-relaxation
MGARRTLAWRLAHTVGADGVFVGLAAGARRAAAAGRDDALLEWRGPAACARGRVRPDGYGLYRHAGHLYGFFLEYDRGTMRPGEYRAKFAAYHDAWASGRFEREYDGLPTILVVTSGPGPERRIAGAIAAAGVGREPPLPVLLTTTGRIESDRSGLPGPIWREPGRSARRHWPVTGGVASPGRTFGRSSPGGCS